MHTANIVPGGAIATDHEDSEAPALVKEACSRVHEGKDRNQPNHVAWWVEAVGC